jgi:hypothetical protein
MESSLITNFYDFLKINGQVADFEPGWKDLDLIHNLVPPSRISELIPLGMHGSQSVIAIWNISATEDMESQPIVWIDSEGSPREVFANSFRDFLALLTYDTNSWYDYITAWQQYLDSPSEYQQLFERYNSDTLTPKDQLASADATYSDHQAYLQWVSSLGIDIPDHPFRVIGQAMQASPRFSQWLASSQ